MKYFGITDKGKQRKDNQDCFEIANVQSRNCLIVALCDGMGGHAAGQLAGKVANRAFVDYARAKLTSRTVRNPDHRAVLQRACEEANAVTYQYSALSDEYHGLGTTLVGAVILDSGKAYLVNVGDSRAYLISHKNETIRQITNDHSLVDSYVRAGMITKEEARVHPQKNIITRALGAESAVRADSFEVTLSKGDMLLFCSDGMSNYFSDDEILHACLENPDPELCCRYLLDATFERGAGDNVTIVAVVK